MVSYVSCLASTNSYRRDTYKTVRHFIGAIALREKIFSVLKNRKAKKTLWTLTIVCPEIRGADPLV